MLLKSNRVELRLFDRVKLCDGKKIVKSRAQKKENYSLSIQMQRPYSVLCRLYLFLPLAELLVVLASHYPLPMSVSKVASMARRLLLRRMHFVRMRE